MAPRGKQDGVVLLGQENTLSRSPLSFESDSFIKSLSNLSFEHEDTPQLNVSNESDEAKASLSASLKLISERGDRILKRILNDKNGANSLMLQACHSSLKSEFTYMLEEAKLLLNNMGNDDECPITSWRISLAQIRADAYLESIQTALDCPDTSLVDVELLKVYNDIVSQLSSDIVDLRISPWNMTSLGFDVSVATPIDYALESRTLPLNLQVCAIQEVQAKDIVNGDKSNVYRACSLKVERCVHEVGSFRAGAGSVGDVLLTIRVSPIVNNDESLTEESRPVIKEARNVQVNAFPPSPKSCTDLYVSYNHGDCDSTITLRFPTYKTLDDDVPQVCVELVMG
jgi:hypothetical protein